MMIRPKKIRQLFDNLELYGVTTSTIAFILGIKEFQVWKNSLNNGSTRIAVPSLFSYASYCRKKVAL